MHCTYSVLHISPRPSEPRGRGAAILPNFSRKVNPFWGQIVPTTLLCTRPSWILRLSYSPVVGKSCLKAVTYDGAFFNLAIEYLSIKLVVTQGFTLLKKYRSGEVNAVGDVYKIICGDQLFKWQ